MDDGQDTFFLLLMAFAVIILLVLFFITDTPPQNPYDIHPVAREALYDRLYRTCDIIHHGSKVDCADVADKSLWYHLEQTRLCNVNTIGRDDQFEQCLVNSGVVTWQP